MNQAWSSVLSFDPVSFRNQAWSSVLSFDPVSFMNQSGVLSPLLWPCEFQEPSWVLRQQVASPYEPPHWPTCPLYWWVVQTGTTRNWWHWLSVLIFLLWCTEQIRSWKENRLSLTPGQLHLWRHQLTFILPFCFLSDLEFPKHIYNLFPLSVWSYFFGMSSLDPSDSFYWLQEALCSGQLTRTSLSGGSICLFFLSSFSPWFFHWKKCQSIINIAQDLLSSK